MPLVVIIIIPHSGEELLEVHSVIGPRVQPCPLEMHVPIVGLIKELPLQDVILQTDLLLPAFGHHRLKPGYRLLCGFYFLMLKLEKGLLGCRFSQF